MSVVGAVGMQCSRQSCEIVSNGNFCQWKIFIQCKDCHGTSEREICARNTSVSVLRALDRHLPKKVVESSKVLGVLVGGLGFCCYMKSFIRMLVSMALANDFVQFGSFLIHVLCPNSFFRIIV